MVELQKFRQKLQTESHLQNTKAMLKLARDNISSPNSRPSGAGVPAGCHTKSLINEFFTPNTLSDVNSSSPVTNIMADQSAIFRRGDHEVQVTFPHRRAQPPRC